MRAGVTGNYASGKGTVCEIFRQFGAIHVDTDIIAREVTAKDSPGLNMIADLFGTEFLLPNGELDRRKLGRTVFNDHEKLVRLTDVLNPLILERTLYLSKDESRIFMINAPVLFEAGFDTYMDIIIVVSTPIDSSINRGMLRDGLSLEEITSRLNNQISLNEKIKAADYVIDNSGSIEQTRIQAEAIWNSLNNSPKTRM